MGTYDFLDNFTDTIMDIQYRKHVFNNNCEIKTIILKLVNPIQITKAFQTLSQVLKLALRMAHNS